MKSLFTGVVRSRIKKISKKRSRAAVAFEWMIQAPLIFIIFVVLLVSLFMSWQYINYNSLATQIANDLNMRQTGYISAMRDCDVPSNALTSAGGSPISISDSRVTARVTFSQPTQEVVSATYCAIDNAEARFKVPFAHVEEIHVDTSKPIRASMGDELAGTYINVTITYSMRSDSWSGSLSGAGSSLFQIKAVGQSVIS